MIKEFCIRKKVMVKSVRTSAAAVLIVFLLGCKNNDKKASNPIEIKKPNIVYVLTDQWRAQATGYNGDPNLIGKTPNIDKLASEGINFKNAVSTMAVCTPYRAALLTGQYPTTTGMFLNDLHLPEESYTMSEMYKESGYNTAYIGKWHLDGMGRFEYTPRERRQGFDYWKALECSHDYNKLFYYEGDDSQRKQWEGYGPYAETEDAISYINRNADGDQPFLLVLAVGAPHFPYHNTPEDTQPFFKPEDIILPDNVNDDFRKKAKKDAAGYYAHILALDKCIGKLQKAIEETGISENTIFIFTSDHGEMLGSHSWRPRQKQVSWAEAVRVPFLLKYPALYKGKKIEVEAPIGTPDILPTLLSMSGLPIPKSIEGESMKYAIDSQEAGKNKAALVMQLAPFAGDYDEYRGIYTSRYTYVKMLDGPTRLFDNKEDPLQMNNLVNKAEFAELQGQMETKLQEELSKIGDEFKPSQYYLDKWNYKVNAGGAIPYSHETSADIVFQGPGLNRNLRKGVK
ncbi:MAG: arylsulfatase A-like enzyme [Cyclobacteriaceae bacterium]|jgi:arylsulfatase A-like enzyme